MKFPIRLLVLMVGLGAAVVRAEPTPDDIETRHAEGAAKVANQQDELSADVQQLIVEQTVPQVIELFEQVREIMGDATDRLADKDTGGETLAAQTEVIEKIHEAAKAKKSQSGGSPSGGAMMDMMERMMGKDPDAGKQPQKGKDGNPSDAGGGGVSGNSDAANSGVAGAADGKSEARRVPKAGGSAGRALPEEFRKALDSYNRGAAEKVR